MLYVTQNIVSTVWITWNRHRVRVIGCNNDERIRSVRHIKCGLNGQIELECLFQCKFAKGSVMSVIDPTTLKQFINFWQNLLRNVCFCLPSTKRTKPLDSFCSILMAVSVICAKVGLSFPSDPKKYSKWSVLNRPLKQILLINSF